VGSGGGGSGSLFVDEGSLLIGRRGSFEDDCVEWI